MAKFVIKFEREKCIGCGSCAAVCPANWEMKDDGKAIPLTVEIEGLGCNQTVVEICPAQCIHVQPASE